jgi:hypothetical protein
LSMAWFFDFLLQQKNSRRFGVAQCRKGSTAGIFFCKQAEKRNKVERCPFTPTK